MKLYEVLRVYEARKNPAQNPRLSPIEQLRKYKDDPNIFISFKDVSWVHINPGYDFGTPTGVYFYPLQVFWQRHASDFEAGKFPQMYATNKRYIHVIKYNGKGDRVIRKPADYTKTDLDHDLKQLDSLGYDVKHMMARLPNNQYTTTPFGQFWNTLNVLTSHISGKTSNGASKMALTKNKILRQLGYAYICERGGAGGVIHPNEPSQGFFTSGAYLKTIDQIDTTLNVSGSTITPRGLGREMRILIPKLTAAIDHAFADLVDNLCAMCDEVEDAEIIVDEVKVSLQIVDDQVAIYQILPSKQLLGFLKREGNELKILNPDGDTMNFKWNDSTGKRVPTSHFDIRELMTYNDDVFTDVGYTITYIASEYSSYLTKIYKQIQDSGYIDY